MRPLIEMRLIIETLEMLCNPRDESVSTLTTTELIRLDQAYAAEYRHFGDVSEQDRWVEISDELATRLDEGGYRG